MIAGSMERRKFFWGLALFAVVCCIFFASAQLAFAATQTGTVATTALNIRSGPGTNYRSMGLLSINKEINILDTVAGSDGKTWYYIAYNGINGYVSAGFIVLNNQPGYETDADFEADLNAQGLPGKLQAISAVTARAVSELEVPGSKNRTFLEQRAGRREQARQVAGAVIFDFFLEIQGGRRL